ncbi:acetyl-CoA hydrolase [Mycobacterium colombiense]|uniref:acetyl-CoA hydrolase/transferase C-terminal domain-containing protein n=1 Tax=Mycobacterium colombiense TaxID=339268 RepID=UPI0007EFD670|nr:acetyl-CoA hydrolase/transferase C-terminal domain-containing protein [Mycobacterium colombiense]OBK68583.1 acetyl-CoA hydrolase [Mycobacterium colombiense]
MTVALGDGVGALRTLADGSCVAAVLSAAARKAGPVRLILGWLPSAFEGLDPDAFCDVVALMPGWGVRPVLRSPAARFVPTSLASMPKLLSGPLRPDLLLTRLVRRDGVLRFGTEVSWQRQLIGAGVETLAIVDSAGPTADAGEPLDDKLIQVIGETNCGPWHAPAKPPEPIHDALADAVLRLVPEGARLQYGPGQLGTALLRRATKPLQIDTGLLTDAVVDLDRRGLLIGTPSATYLLGSDTLYQWADGRHILRGVDYTHDLTRLSRGQPFVAVNTAIEIDPAGQVNVEGVGEKVVGGIGGHPDYCAAARLSCEGLSIIAVPSKIGGRAVLVEQLSRPASTPAHDVDVIVTEQGHADLRTADWPQRRKLITELFNV